MTHSAKEEYITYDCGLWFACFSHFRMTWYKIDEKGRKKNGKRVGEVIKARSRWAQWWVELWVKGWRREWEGQWREDSIEEESEEKGEGGGTKRLKRMLQEMGRVARCMNVWIWNDLRNVTVWMLDDMMELSELSATEEEGAPRDKLPFPSSYRLMGQKS